MFRSFEKKSLFRGCAERCEVGEWYAHHKRTGTGADKEHKRSLGPFVPVERVSAGKEGDDPGYNENQHGESEDYWSVPAGDAPEHGLGGRFRGLGVLYHVENPAHGGVGESADSAYLDRLIDRNDSRREFLARLERSGYRFSGYGRCVELCRSVAEKGRVDRDAFAWTHEKQRVFRKFRRRHCPQFIPLDHSGCLRKSSQKLADPRPDIVRRLFLEFLSYAVEQKNGDGLRIFPDNECTRRGGHHQCEFVHHTAVAPAFQHFSHHRNPHRENRD